MNEKNKRRRPRQVLATRPTPVPGAPLVMTVRQTAAGVRVTTKFIAQQNGLTYRTVSIAPDVAMATQLHLARLGLITDAGIDTSRFAQLEAA